MKPSEKLKQLREKEGLSQAAFAAKYGLKEHTIGFIEKERQDIQVDLAKQLEKEYKIPFKWWMTGEGPDSLEEKPCQNLDDLKQIAKEYFGVETDEELEKCSEALMMSGGKEKVMEFAAALLKKDPESINKLIGFLEGLKFGK